MENVNKTYDVIVVGAGTGGAIASRFAAKKGLSVCLIERKPREEIGNKICGDAVGNDIFDFLDINHPKGKELSCNIKGAKLYPPNKEKCLTLIDPKQAGYVINRVEFGQRLLKEALDCGVDTFLDNTMALDLTYEDKNVNGVTVKLKNGEKKEINSKLVIDASGLNSRIRKSLKNSQVEQTFKDEDAILCFREIISFPQKDQEVMDPEYITIIMDQEKAPGGYIWYFPKNDYSVNMGLGVYMHYGGKVKDFYKRNVFSEFIKTDKTNIISSGGGVVPVRRPSWSCLDEGIMLVGDAAYQVNPLHGGGIDSSMRAGYHAAITAVRAIKNNDFSISSLWEYNEKVMITLGSEFAALDLLRRVLQSLSNEDLNFGLTNDLLTGSEILEIASTGGLNLSLFDMATKAFKGISRPNLLLDLNYLRIRMNEIAKLYKNFPSTVNEFPEWKASVKKIYEKVNRMIIQVKN